MTILITGGTGYTRKDFSSNDISDVIHFVGLKSVPESIHKPLEYYKKMYLEL